jgi:D-alanine transfer protein
MLKKFLLNHVLAILIVAAVVFIVTLLIPSGEMQIEHIDVVPTNSEPFTGHHPVLGTDDIKIDYLSSMKDTNTLVLFGSSELNSDSKYLPYLFLKDSLRLDVFTVGKGHHQNFAILCELLAANDFLENKNICIFLSPSWFAEDGTNVEIFLNNFDEKLLTKLFFDESIHQKYKLAIAEYLSSKSQEIQGYSIILELYKQLHLENTDSKHTIKESNIVQRIKDAHINKIGVKIPIYQLKERADHSINKRKAFNWNFEAVKNDFINNKCSNDIYVNDRYYKAHLLDKNGELKTNKLTEKKLEGNREIQDFELVLGLIKEKKMNVSFVMQPLNPYYYENLEVYREVLTYVNKRINEEGYPYLDMFKYSKETYEPATLDDIMHLGDLGWLKVHQFIDKTYPND